MYQGEKILLRSYRREDIPTTWEYINNPKVKRFLTPGIPYPMTLEEEEKWFERQTAFGDTYNFAIERIEDGAYIGGCGINEVNWKNSIVTVGIFLGEIHWNKGYGTDAMRALVRFIFEQMNINKIKLNVYSFNERAVKSYEKCGFKTEGVLRQEIFRDGKYYDEYVMGILKEEYFKK